MKRFAHDSFTDTDGLNVVSHVGEHGATWTRRGNGTNVISSNNRLRFGNGTGNTLHAMSAIPPSDEYEVEGWIHCVSDAGFIGIAGRVNMVNDSMYYLRPTAGSGWQLAKAVNGTTFTTLASYSQSLVVGQTYHLRLVITNAYKKGFIDGVERLSTTDNTVTGKGLIGVRANPVTGGLGFHLDSISAFSYGSYGVSQRFV